MDSAKKENGDKGCKESEVGDKERGIWRKDVDENKERGKDFWWEKTF